MLIYAAVTAVVKQIKIYLFLYLSVIFKNIIMQDTAINFGRGGGGHQYRRGFIRSPE